VGHSMGGGGTLRTGGGPAGPAGGRSADCLAHNKSWPTVKAATMVIGAEPFYQSLSSTPDKAYLERRSCRAWRSECGAGRRPLALVARAP
jgi:hypothetical protein